MYRSSRLRYVSTDLGSGLIELIGLLVHGGGIRSTKCQSSYTCVGLCPVTISVPSVSCQIYKTMTFLFCLSCDHVSFCFFLKKHYVVLRKKFNEERKFFIG